MINRPLTEEERLDKQNFARIQNIAASKNGASVDAAIAELENKYSTKINAAIQAGNLNEAVTLISNIGIGVTNEHSKDALMLAIRYNDKDATTQLAEGVNVHDALARSSIFDKTLLNATMGNSDLFKIIAEKSTQFERGAFLDGLKIDRSNTWAVEFIVEQGLHASYSVKLDTLLNKAKSLGDTNLASALIDKGAGLSVEFTDKLSHRFQENAVDILKANPDNPEAAIKQALFNTYGIKDAALDKFSEVIDNCNLGMGEKIGIWMSSLFSTITYDEMKAEAISNKVGEVKEAFEADISGFNASINKAMVEKFKENFVDEMKKSKVSNMDQAKVQAASVAPDLAKAASEGIEKPASPMPSQTRGGGQSR